MKKILLVLLINLPIVLIGQEAIVEKLLKRGDSLLFVKQHNEARILYEKAKENSKQNQYEYFQNLATYKIGYSYLREDSEFLALAYFTEIQLTLYPLTAQDSALLALVSLEIDIASYKSVKSGFSSADIEKAVSKYIPFLDRNEQNRIEYLLAEIFVQRLEHKKAIESFKVLLNTQILDPWLYELSIYSLAEEYEILLEFQKAIEHFWVLEGKEVLYTNETELFERIWYNYYRLENYKAALKYLRLTLGSYTEDINISNLIDNYWHQGNCYLMLGRYDKVIPMIDKAEILAKEKKSPSNLIKVYLQKSYFYRKMGKIANAEYYIDKSFALSKSHIIGNRQKLLIVNQGLRIYLKQNRLEKAMLMVHDFELSIPDSALQEYRVYNYLSDYRLFYIAKGLLLRKVWESDSAQFQFLEQAHKAFIEALNISQNLYTNLEHEKTKLKVVNSLRIDYENLFLTSYNLYTITKDQKYLEDIFQFQQQGKATLFKSIIHESEALYESDIPEDLLQMEAELRKQIERLNYYINPITSNGLNMETRENLHKDLVHAKLRYDSLMNHVEEEFPNYNQQRYGIESYGISNIQKTLGKDQLVIDYFITEGRLFKMLIGKSEIRLFESKVEWDFRRDLVNYRALLQDPSINNKGKTNLNSLVYLSHKVYRSLLGDIENELFGKRLLIVPDKELNLIPFETLIVSTVDTLIFKAATSFPYLVKKNSITMLYSQSQLLDRSRKLSKKSKLICFAPDYSNFKDSSLVVLPGTQKEIQQISKIFKGTTYIGDKATKEKFEKESVNYNIVHLALHTLINDNNPNHSQLVFTYKENPVESHLTSYEVYGMRFKAALLVLSGCNTGAGELKSGEGEMHLARNFFFSGIKNIVLTKWAVADKSSASIMQYFYQYLYKGYPVDIALQKAKIDFLSYEDPIKHHPYYWAGYISAGKSAEYKPRIFYYWCFILLLVLIKIIMKKRNSF